MDAKRIQKALAEAVKHHRAGRHAEAESTYLSILASDPRHPDALYLLGTLAHHSGDLNRAIELIRKAIEIDPTVAEYYNNLGSTLLDKGSPDEALKAFEKAVQLDPKMVEARTNLGRTLIDLGSPHLAITELQKSLQLQPQFVRALNELGRAHRMLGQLDPAAAAFEAAIRVRPQSPQGHNNLGNISKDRGDLDRAIECFRKAISVGDSYHVGHSNLICTMHFHPDYDMGALHREQREWNRHYAQQLGSSVSPHDNNANADRKLRIGFVSPDFCEHCLSLFNLPLLRNLDREEFDIICYSNVVKPDGITEQFRETAREWRNSVGMTDEALAGQIRQDRIDILVDLTMHLARNRLLAFAQKPAPVQCSWIAYPGSTGLDSIDYRLTDPHLDPPGLFDQYYSEKSIRLPDTFWCYDPCSSESFSASPPALKQRGITFGCLNNFCKVNRGVLATWAGVMNQVVDSRLILLSEIGKHRQRTLDILKSHGIDSSRVEFSRRLPRNEYLAQYHKIDLCLDTVPYNGHTTTLDAMWMGVPTVTLVGSTVAGRAGLSQYSNVGLTELVAHSEVDFVRIATELSRDLDRLASIRATLRQRMEASPLMDAPRFARNMGSAFRWMWKQWCSR